MKLPDTLTRTLRDIHRDTDAWLANVDGHVRHCEQRWQVRVTGLVPDLSYNVVMFAESLNNTPYVLKLSPPNSELEQEGEALALYGGDGICRLIERDNAVGALLLERLEPGVSLWRNRDDDLATRTAATLMQQLWRPVRDPRPFRTLQSWSRSLPKYLDAHPDRKGPLPHSLLEKAHDLLTTLLEDSNEPVLLHADLHHGNIVSATRQPYLAIDPKGIVGPRGYEVGPFLLNPTPNLAEYPDSTEILNRRIAVFSEMLDLSAKEVAAWGMIHTVLAACWTLEDHGDGWGAALTVAGKLESLI